MNCEFFIKSCNLGQIIKNKIIEKKCMQLVAYFFRQLDLLRGTYIYMVP